MPVKVVRRYKKYRVVEAKTGRIARATTAGDEEGKAIDGGGHSDQDRAKRQARAINSAWARSRK